MCCRDLIASFWYLIPMLHVMINELDELLLESDSNGANYKANAVTKWASGSCTEDCRHTESLWWRDGRWKRTIIGRSCSSKVPTVDEEFWLTTMLKKVPLPWPHVSTLMVVFIQKQVRLLVPQHQQCHKWKPKVMIFLKTCSQEIAETECPWW